MGKGNGDSLGVGIGNWQLAVAVVNDGEGEQWHLSIFISGQTNGRESAQSGPQLPHKHAIEDGKGERWATVVLHPGPYMCSPILPLSIFVFSLMPTQRAQRCPGRPENPKHGTKRRQQLGTLNNVDMFEHLICHGMVVLAYIPDTCHIPQFWNLNKAKCQFGGLGERDG